MGDTRMDTAGGDRFQEMDFFSADWARLGTKGDLCSLLLETTGIDSSIVMGDRGADTASVTRRMSWASKRKTTRPEDLAYCLMGIFSVNMPMLYGEGGGRAFIRLQEEIMKSSDDHSIFAWSRPEPPAAHPRELQLHGLLAKSVADFAEAGSMFPYKEWEARSPYAMTNRGLQIELPLRAHSHGLYLASLDCPSPPNYKPTRRNRRLNILRIALYDIKAAPIDQLSQVYNSLIKASQ